MEIGHRIKKAREAAGMSQRDLARAIGVSNGAVGGWESHVKKPSRENLHKIATVTMTDHAVLLSDISPDVPKVTITDPRTLAMLRVWKLMSRQQQDNLLELLGISVDVRRKIERKRQPV